MTRLCPDPDCGGIVRDGRCTRCGMDDDQREAYAERVAIVREHGRESCAFTVLSTTGEPDA